MLPLSGSFCLFVSLSFRMSKSSFECRCMADVESEMTPYATDAQVCFQLFFF